ncbi:MAG: DUF5050 domain-containing protein [Oscillospiraceae bacterium]|nr:DUF5050 domain-containing protein [Oscillospiraceae bacterium]
MRNRSTEIVNHGGRWLIFLIVLTFFATVLAACGVKKVQVSAVTSGEVRLNEGKPLEIAFSAEDTRAMSNYMLEGRFLHSGKTLYGSRHDESGDPYLCCMKFSAGQKGMHVRETEVMDTKTDAKYLLLDNGFLYYLRKDRLSGNTSIVRIPSAMGSETRPETLYSEPCDFLFRRGGQLYFTDANGHLCSMPLAGGDVQPVVSDKTICYPYLLTEDLLLFQDDADGESLHMRYLPTGFELKISNGRVLCYVVKGSDVWFLRAEELGSEKCRLCRADLNEFLHGFDPTARPDASFQFTIEESSESMGPLFSINGGHINASNYQTADFSNWRSLADNAWEKGYLAACQYVSEDFEIFYDYNEEGRIDKMLFYEPSVKRRSNIELYKYS